MKRFRIGMLAVTALSVVLVWALPAGAQSSKTATAKVTTVNVTAGSPSEFKFKLSKLRVPKGIVVFNVKNVGAVGHDFKIAGRKTRVLQHNQSATLRVTFPRAAKFKYVCTVPTHETLGMWGNLTIT